MNNEDTTVSWRTVFPPGGQAAASANDWLKLRHCHGIGNITLFRLLQHFGSVSATLAASYSELKHAGLSHAQAEALSQPDSEAIDRDLAWLQQKDHHIICVDDMRYPHRLSVLDDAPPVIYLRGDPDYLAQPQLAIVGSRNATAAGRATATEFARHLSGSGLTITSGLATGIDGAAHRGAVEGIAGTIAVVAHGLDIVYPAQHQKLAEQITANGAILSEMPTGTTPVPGLFPRRNRLISAMSLGTLVVEAAKNSGSLITARLAMEQGREVFAIPGSIHNPLARGCHQLIRQGAKLVETAGDILEEISSILPPGTQNQARQGDQAALLQAGQNTENTAERQSALDPDYQKLLKCLANEPASVDELVSRSRFSAAEVASMLLILELQGTVVSENGRYTRLATDRLTKGLDS